MPEYLMNTSERVLLPIKWPMRYSSKLFNNSISFQLFSICFLIFFQLILSGCAAHQVMFDRAVVFNATDGIISEVKVRHERKAKMINVSSRIVFPAVFFMLLGWFVSGWSFSDLILPAREWFLNEFNFHEYFLVNLKEKHYGVYIYGKRGRIYF